jgi:hypothetical protein
MTETNSGSTRRILLWTVGVCVLLSFGTCGGCLLWLMSQPEGGVRAANQMEPYALEYIEKHGLLEPGEKLIAYYDGTMDMDATESALLTSSRVVYHLDGRTTAVRLEDIEAVNTSEVPLIGDIIDIRSTQGELVRIEIAPLNGGQTFIRELEAARSRLRPREEPTTGTP